MLQSFQKKGFAWGASLISALLLSLSWYWGLSFLMFMAFIPLLLLEDYIAKQNPPKAAWKFFGFVYLTMLLWNLGATWWIWNASAPGAVAAWVLNALFQTWPFLAYRITKKNAGPKLGYLSLPVYWIAFEYLHLNWQFSWTWLNIGNALSDSVAWVQWYEYTGVFGGALWILSVNILLYLFLKEKKNVWRIIAAAVLLLPMGFSFLMYYNFEEKGRDTEVAVIQPNLDCYSEKFQYNAQTGEQNTESYVPFPKQVERFIVQSREASSPETRFVAWPETALHQSVNLANIEKYPHIKRINTFLDSLDNTAILSGIDTYVTTKDKNKATENARYRKDLGYYDVYSSAVMLYPGQKPEAYHKSQLVIGAETIPFRNIFKALIMNFGGTSGGLSIQKEREVLYGPDSLGVAPAICYESIFGEYMTDYIKKGAQAIFVITNDGWWGDTPGARQHWRYAKLRAIETRKPVARSANTGISGFIDARGDELAKSEYGEKTVLTKKIKFNGDFTFYTRNGDILGRLSAFFAVAFLLSVLVRGKVAQSSLFR